MRVARFTRSGARLVLSAGGRDLSILEGGIESDWALGKALCVLGRDMLASGWGSRLDSCENVAAWQVTAITELVIVEAMRNFNSGAKQ